MSYTQAQMRDAVVRAQDDGIRATVRTTGIPYTTLQRWLKNAAAVMGETETVQGNGFEVTKPVDVIDLPELIERRKRAFARKQRIENAGKLVDVRVKLDGPIGLLHLGDPHVDDDGTDLALLERHCRIVQTTEGMFVGNVGDTTNNWVGRLARLYAQQSTTASEAWALAEWLFEMLGDKAMYLVGGNHDAWSGDGDPLSWIARQHNRVAANQSSEVRIKLKFPKGRDVRVNARHDFRGSSIWNPAHGAMKSLQVGVRDHIAVCGHKHVSGYGVLKDPDTGMVGHAIQVAAYKIIDRYAREGGFRDQHISPCAVTIIDPCATHEANVVQLFWEPEIAADYLTFLRRRADR